MTVHSGNELVVKRWSQEHWLASETAWNDLIQRSTADPLFLSWEWLTLWWQLYGAARGNELYLLTAERGGRLVGAAPLYVHEVHRGLLRTRSIQFVGVSWRDPTALVSQYLDVIADPAEAQPVRDVFAKHLLADEGWGEFVIGQTAAQGTWATALSAGPWSTECYCRTVDHSTSYQADLSQGFEQYLQSLGGNSRRSLWHLRRRLEASGPVSFETVGAAEVDEAFDQLNELHQRRWRRPAFTGARLEFHRRLARSSAARGELALTRLRVAGRVVSLVYDLRRRGRQYNLKMAFDPTFLKQGSLGLLHLGYAMEHAAAHGGARYDFLAGRGQRSDYKRNIGPLQIELITVQCVRKSPLRQLYRVYDRVWPKSLRLSRRQEE